jgi:adenosylhomocysteine nucleosidase
VAILFVAAEKAELERFADRLVGVRKLKWPLRYAVEGILEGRRVMLAAHGAGPRLAAQAVEVAIRAVTAAELSSSRLEAVVNAGFCGALAPELREGQIVVATAVLDLKSQESYACAALASEYACDRGLIVTQDRIAISAAEKGELSASSAVAVDMEASGVAERAKRAGLPFVCIKVVSDRADESFGFDLNSFRTSEGRIARGKIGIYALTHPKFIPELLRLKRRTEHAAKALGDFLVSCRITFEGNAPATA